MRKRASKGIVWLLALTMLLAMAVRTPVEVSAAQAPSMEVQFEKDWYHAGEVITAKVYIKNATFNAAGFSLKYDTDVMTVVAEDGTEGDKPGLIRIENKYDENEDTGSKQSERQIRSGAVAFKMIPHFSQDLLHRYTFSGKETPSS